MRRQHLTKQHGIDEEVYIALFEGGKCKQLTNCQLCSRDCLDLTRHLRQCHSNLGKAEYLEKVKDCPDDSSAGGSNFACRLLGCGSTFAKSHQLLMHVKMDHSGGTEEEMESIWKMAMEELFSSKCSGASMPCAICGHLLNSRCIHTFLIGLRLKNVRSSLWQHVTRRHKTSWEDYIEEYGDPSTEVSLFSKT